MITGYQLLASSHFLTAKGNRVGCGEWNERIGRPFHRESFFCLAREQSEGSFMFLQGLMALSQRMTLFGWIVLYDPGIAGYLLCVARHADGSGSNPEPYTWQAD